MFIYLIIMALCALLAAIVLPVVVRAWKGIVTAKTHRKRTSQFRAFLRHICTPIYHAMDRFMSWFHHVEHGAVPLANELATINENGLDTQIIDPSASLPTASRYLLYKRGAAGTGYVDVCGASDMPLGPSPDSAYQVGDLVNIRRLGARPGLELGIPATAITVDDLVITAAAGKIQAFTGVANGTYWVVGRAVKTTAATAGEAAYVPEAPYKITVSGGTGTVVVA